MKIEKNKMVSIDYVLTDKDGIEIDSSKKGGPLEYLHGNGNLIPGLETKLEGLEEGSSIKVVVEPKDAYGEYDDSLIIEVPRDRFDIETPIEIGMMFQAGPSVVRIIKIADDVVTVDANHELAGKTLCFNVDVRGVREATEEELKPSKCSGSCGNCDGSCGGNCDGECDEEDGCSGDCSCCN
jgi:FKBP-type peptidyl-prolyl cis-trans isomerase SlyD